MTTATIYLRVEPRVKEFFTKKAKEQDRPLNYFVGNMLTSMMEKEAVKKVTKKKVVRRKKSEIDNNK